RTARLILPTASCHIFRGDFFMTHSRWPVLLALAVLAHQASPAFAREAPSKEPARLPAVVLPKPAEVVGFSAQAPKVVVKGLDDAHHLTLTANLGGGKVIDLTHDVRYEISDNKIARVTATGRIVPLANGTAVVTAHYGDKSTRVSVTCESCDVDLPI